VARSAKAITAERSGSTVRDCGCRATGLNRPSYEAGPQETEATRNDNARKRRPFRFETSGSAPCRPSPEGARKDRQSAAL